MLSKIILAGGAAAFCSAYMLISTPVPFNTPTLHNRPLQPDNSNFPYQSLNKVYQTGGTINTIILNSIQALTFLNTTIYSKSSYQISITYDIAPNKSSAWKVIHSIKGGYPARDTPSNLRNNPNFKLPFDYNFPIPNNIPAGNATIT